MTYSGEKRHFGFEEYSTAHKKNHQILVNLEPHGYKGIDEGSKVRYLLNGIKDPSLDATKNTILADSRLRNNYDGCVTLFKTFINQKATSETHSTRQISQVSFEGDATVEDRYYSKEEYSRLTKEQKDALRQKRTKRGHKPGSKSSKVIHGGDAKRQKTGGAGNKKFSRSISALAKQVASLSEKMDAKHVPDVVSTDGSSNSDSTSTSNRNNSALTRQK